MLDKSLLFLNRKVVLNISGVLYPYTPCGALCPEAFVICGLSKGAQLS